MIRYISSISFTHFRLILRLLIQFLLWIEIKLFVRNTDFLVADILHQGGEPRATVTATQRVEQRPELVWFCVLLVLGTSVPLSLLRPLLGLGGWTGLRVSPGLGPPLRLLLPLGVGGPRPGRVEAGDAELRQVSDPPLVELESLSLGDVHVSWKVVLSNPGHVLP